MTKAKVAERRRPSPKDTAVAGMAGTPFPSKVTVFVANKKYPGLSG
jgi:hypothetical protein